MLPDPVAATSAGARPFARGELFVSQTQMNTYLLCSEQFRLKYVNGASPSHRSSELVFGSAVHATLAMFHNHMKDFGFRQPSDLMCRVFDEQFAKAIGGNVPVLWQDADARERLVEQGRALVTLYVETAKIGKVLAVEQPFSLAPDRLPRAFAFTERVVGVIDLIEQDEDGSVVITELKTAARKFDDQRLQHDMPLSLYAAVANELGFSTAKLRFRVLLKQKKPAMDVYDVRRDSWQLTETGRTMTQVLRAIDHGIFYPVRSWACSTCAYRAECGDEGEPCLS